jgi:hypothetical protein
MNFYATKIIRPQIVTEYYEEQQEQTSDQNSELDNQEIRVQFQVEIEIFSSSQRSDWLCGQSRFLSKGPGAFPGKHMIEN